MVTAQEVGRGGVPDPDQLAHTTAEGRVMVTFDTDYLALHRSGVQQAGIAWCPATKYGVGPLVQMLVLLHGVMDQDAMRNHVEYL